MFLGQIDEKFSAGRPDFKLSSFLGALMQEAGDEALGFLLYADTKVIFARGIRKTLVAHGRLPAIIRNANGDVLARLEQRQAAAIRGLQIK
jgi:hypothetical protein